MGEQGGVSRRDVLKLGGATGTLTAMAGCLGWITGGGNDDDGTDDEERTEQPENENTDGETPTNEETDPGGDTTENETNTQDENETGGDGNESESANETDTESDNESEAQEQEKEELTPDKNETEPDKEQYEKQEEREIVELPEDTVEVDLQADQIAQSESSPGGLHIYGSVTNVSEQYVDTVDLDISIYDEAGEYIGADIVSMSDLESGESADVDRQISAYDLQGQPASVEIDVMVYGPE